MLLLALIFLSPTPPEYRDDVRPGLRFKPCEYWAVVQYRNSATGGWVVRWEFGGEAEMTAGDIRRLVSLGRELAILREKHGGPNPAGPVR